MWVIVRGGLGNQMFQAAFAISLAKRFAVVPRFMDFSSTALVPRRWELGCFGIKPAPVSEFVRYSLTGISFASQKLQRIGLFPLPGVLSETDGKLRVDQLSRGPGIVAGYWQSERYFADCEESVRKLFSMRELPTWAVAPESDEYRPSVAIHVRRGDYVSNPVARRVHLVCDAGWYRRAWTTLRHDHPQARGFVFSDDPDWARSNLELDGEIEYVTGMPEAEPWIDLARMSQCQHFIISNSSYSWWAAWLGRDPDKQVIAPREWFRGRATAELGIAPAEWTLL
jgi:hypothetical protein